MSLPQGRRSTVPYLRPSQAQVKLWARLEGAKVRHGEGLFLAEGFKVTAELIASGWETRAVLVLEEKKARWEKFLASLTPDLDVYLLTASQWAKLTQDGEPEGIMGLAAVPDCLANPRYAAAGGAGKGRPAADRRVGSDAGVREEEAGGGHIVRDVAAHAEDYLVLLHRIGNPGNLGTILRTAHWFGIGAVLLSAGSVDLTHPKAVRASMGSLFHLRLAHGLDFAALLPSLRGQRLLVAGDVRGGRAPHPCPGGAAIILGSETHGLPDELLAMADERWHIPGAGGAESLSLPQAAAVMMYECTKK